ncbi:MAG: hypothetical protein ABEI39_00720 [Halobacteriales archaeon]
MGLWFDLARVAAVFNLVVLAGLGYVWAGNVRRLRSKHALGLLVFAALMFAENGLAVYYFTMSPMARHFARMPAPPQLAMLLLRVLTSGALVFLAWVTWD